LIAARAAQGLGAAVMMALTMAFVGETVPKDKIECAMGLLGKTSAMGAVFALASGTWDNAAARPGDVAAGMRTTFAVAATLLAVALGVATKSQSSAKRAATPVAVGPSLASTSSNQTRGVEWSYVGTICSYS
jgi:MFS family permease